jgi:hypothetical protein
MKIKILILSMITLLLMSCDMNDLFDKGDAENVYDGPTVVGFFPLQQEVNLSRGNASVQIQLIGAQRTSPLSVAFSVDGASTAQAGVHYNLTSSSPVTLPANSSIVNVQLDLISGSLNPGQSGLLILNLQGGEGVGASENLATARIFIRG